jgi:MFS family permease
MGGFGTVMVFFLLPETYPHPSKGDLSGQTPKEKAKLLWHKVNPFRVAGLLLSYPNLLFAALATSALVWNQYSLLTPIRYVLNPRFNLTTPLQSGLLYIAPGGGYLIGTLLGGRWADYIVRRWIRKRGERVPEDRLKSSLPFMLVILPVCMLVYGWTVQERAGGMAVPIVVMVLQGIAQLFAIPSLNTYCLDVMQPKGRSAEAVAGNYMLRYVFAAVGSGVVLPAVQAIGVGWFSTVSAAFLFASGLGVWATSIFGTKWREHVNSND